MKWHLAVQVVKKNKEKKRIYVIKALSSHPTQWKQYSHSKSFEDPHTLSDEVSVHVLHPCTNLSAARGLQQIWHYELLQPQP